MALLSRAEYGFKQCHGARQGRTGQEMAFLPLFFFEVDLKESLEEYMRLRRGGARIFQTLFFSKED